jgi:phenylacetate-CoA ligase
MRARFSLLRAIGLPLIERCTRSRFWTLYGAMRAYDRLPATARQAKQNDRLALMLQHAGRNVPLWRERFAALGQDPASVTDAKARDVLGALPLLTKSALRDGFPHQVTAEGQRDDWRLQASAGTTDRISVVHDFDKRDHLRAAELRTLQLLVGRDVGVECVDIPPNACNVVCGLADPGPTGFFAYAWESIRARTLTQPQTMSDLRGRFERQFVLRRTTLPPIDPAPMTQLRETLDSRLDEIVRIQPALVRGLPLYLLWLADRARERGVRVPSLKAALPFGGLTSSAMAQRIRDGLGAPFRDSYGTSELGAIAVSCGEAAGLHVFEDLFVVEVLRDGRPAEPGEVGRIVITDLSNRAMPIIRYDIGDVGRLIPDACACGQAGSRIELLGRAQEVLAGARDQPVTSAHLLDLFFRFPQVVNFRVDELNGRQYAATVVFRNGSAAPDLAVELQTLLAASQRPRIRTAAFVRPEPSGKYRVSHPKTAVL